jgi:hypothetical protein
MAELHGPAPGTPSRKNRVVCVMTDERARLLADLEAIAVSIQDPAKRLLPFSTD